MPDLREAFNWNLRAMPNGLEGLYSYIVLCLCTFNSLLRPFSLYPPFLLLLSLFYFIVLCDMIIAFHYVGVCLEMYYVCECV